MKKRNDLPKYILPEWLKYMWSIVSCLGSQFSNELSVQGQGREGKYKRFPSSSENKQNKATHICFDLLSFLTMAATSGLFRHPPNAFTLQHPIVQTTSCLSFLHIGNFMYIIAQVTSNFYSLAGDATSSSLFILSLVLVSGFFVISVSCYFLLSYQITPYGLLNRTCDFLNGTFFWFSFFILYSVKSFLHFV